MRGRWIEMMNVIRISGIREDGSALPANQEGEHKGIQRKASHPASQRTSQLVRQPTNYLECQSANQTAISLLSLIYRDRQTPQWKSEVSYSYQLWIFTSRLSGISGQRSVFLELDRRTFFFFMGFFFFFRREMEGRGSCSSSGIFFLLFYARC